MRRTSWIAASLALASCGSSPHPDVPAFVDLAIASNRGDADCGGGAGDGGDGGACPHGDGLYCGGDGISGDASTLYRCTGGNLTVVQVCSGGCQKMPPGQNDTCGCPYGDGLYCGGDGISGNAATLYRCTGGILSVVKVCPNGCHTLPAGQNDVCY
jgi:hypothetical protein